MIELKHSDFGDRGFLVGLNTLANMKTSSDRAYRIMKLTQKIDRARKDVQQAYRTEVVDQFSKKDEAGKPMLSRENEFGFVLLDGQEEAAKAAHTTFGLGIAKIDHPKLSLSDLRDAELSASDMEAIMPLVLQEEAPCTPVENVQSIR